MIAIPPPTAAAVDLDELGSRVWDALEAAGYSPAPAGCGTDGFDILKPTTGVRDHVMVIARCEGALYGIASTRVHHQILARWVPRLTEAGFSVGHHEVDGAVVALAIKGGES